MHSLFSAVEESSWLMRTIPVIAADTTAYKFKPEDPGGTEVLHQARRAGHEIRQGSEVAPGWPQVARKQR
jgi:hypothetical protein